MFCFIGNLRTKDFVEGLGVFHSPRLEMIVLNRFQNDSLRNYLLSID